MQARIQRLFDTVLEDEEARELVAENPLAQDIVFRIDGGEDVIVSLEPDTADVTVRNGSAEYDLFTTTVLELDEETLESLLEGAYLSEHYLEGDLQISGLPSIKILLGQLFRINHDRR
jgi:hypothetical protein